MNATALPAQIDPYRWGTIFAVLSLDVAAPFVSNMGLQLQRSDALRSGLRRIIADYRKLEASQGNADASFLRAVFDWAAKDFGQGFSNYLYAWGQNVFQSGGGDGVKVFLWNNIFRRGGLNGEKDHRPPPQFVTVLRKMLAKRTKAAVNRMDPVSDWDKEVYERQHYDRFRNAMELVQATISYHDFVSAWQEALAAAGEVNLAGIEKWGAEEAQILGMPLDRLGKPGDWASLPSPPADERLLP
jgi:hypothetical protein